MSKITYWHMQMHQDDNNREALINVASILEHRKIIGLGKWVDGKGQKESFCNSMKVNDIVAIKAGSKFIALVQIIGGYYEASKEKDEMVDWIVYRRPVRVLDWEIDGKKVRQCPQPRGTLNLCKSDHADTTKIIKKWHENIMSSFKERGISVTV